MVKTNGKNGEHLIILNVPHLGEKINKTCANRPLSCVNGENPSDFGAAKETAYRCMAALGRRACPLRLLRRHLSQRERLWRIGQALLRTTSQARRKLLAKAGLRHPASASLCLRIAGRGPNNGSLFPPLAAVAIVAPTEGSLWRRDEALRYAKASPR